MNTAIVWPIDSVVTSLLIDKDISGSFPGFATGFFPSAELFHDTYGLGIPVFQSYSSKFFPVLSPALHNADHSSLIASVFLFVT